MTIEELYKDALKKCKRAIAQGKRYVGFRATRDGYEIIATQSDQNGNAAYRFPEFDAETWAENVVYRMEQLGMLPDEITDADLDRFFDERG